MLRSWLLLHSVTWVIKILSQPLWSSKAFRLVWHWSAGILLWCLFPPANNGKNYKLSSSYKNHAPGLNIIGILPTHAVHAVLTHASIPGVGPSAFHDYTFPFCVTPLATLWGCYTTYADGSPPRVSIAAPATLAKSDTACHCSCWTPGGPLPRLRARCRPWPNLGGRDGRQIC